METKQAGLELGIEKKQIGMMKASMKNVGLMATARRIAKTLAADGPVSIDDVVLKMKDMNYHIPKNSGNWRGSVFATSEWVCVDHVPSSIPSNHARTIKLWALKSWLDTNGRNGGRNTAFDISKLVREVARANPGCDKDDYVIVIGRERLDPMVETMVLRKPAGDTVNRMLGYRVVVADKSVGALMLHKSIFDKNGKA